MPEQNAEGGPKGRPQDAVCNPFLSRSDGQQAVGGLHTLERAARHSVGRRDRQLEAAYLEHRGGMVAGFTKRYGVKMLVWYELHADFPSAIKRETQLKKWNRAWKLELIESTNQDWRDLWDHLVE